MDMPLHHNWGTGPLPYVRVAEKEQLLVRELRESRKKGLPAVPGLPLLVSDDGLVEAPIIGDVLAQGQLAVDVIVNLSIG